MSNFKAGNSRFSRFVNGKGFYIALAICLVAIGTAAYVAVNGSGGALKSVKSDSNASSQQIPSSSIPSWDNESAAQTDNNVSGVNDNRKSSSSSEAASSQPAKPSSSSAPAASSKPENNASSSTTKLVFVQPVRGAILTAYSPDKPTYDQTMNDWRVHDGVDIAGTVGTPVKACADGKVVSVRTDDMLGQEVVIDHGDGLQSVYANLSTQVMVKKGQRVDVNDTIGSIGNTASGEVAIASHLHFEMTKNGSPIDPLAKIVGES